MRIVMKNRVVSVSPKLGAALIRLGKAKAVESVKVEKPKPVKKVSTYKRRDVVAENAAAVEPEPTSEPQHTQESEKPMYPHEHLE